MNGSTDALTDLGIVELERPRKNRIMQLPVVGQSNFTDPTDRFAQRIERQDGRPLSAKRVEILQVNVGKLCNQACKHCHVDAGPARTEIMTEETARQCIAALEQHEIKTLDLTGGAPEMNPHFRWMVRRARAAGAQVIVRHNLTIQFESGYEDLVSFFADQSVDVVCSLPHFEQDATDRQRGRGVFDKSIAGLRALNAVGYGQGRADRALALVHNPVGAYLPGAQSALEGQYRQELKSQHGITFDALYVITNMPIRRFKDWLVRTGQHDEYQGALESAFNLATIPSLMCRNTLSVSWDGRLFDCDFNQMLDLELHAQQATLATVSLDKLAGRVIATGNHCFGCTAGTGSSCGGQLT
ncbi:MAG: arsenosugar biosynthesis radical SAM protein ArsS [Deltaproteobacteria bacterium]|nr:arsenosugar biosynthesis radical SAM protein ArsS [Deltaproteobacteria bacterium]